MTMVPPLANKQNLGKEQFAPHTPVTWSRQYIVICR